MKTKPFFKSKTVWFIIGALINVETPLIQSWMEEGRSPTVLELIQFSIALLTAIGGIYGRAVADTPLL